MLSEIPLSSPTEPLFYFNPPSAFSFLFFPLLLLLLLLVLEAVRDGTHTAPSSPANVRLLIPEEEKKKSRGPGEKRSRGGGGGEGERGEQAMGRAGDIFC